MKWEGELRDSVWLSVWQDQHCPDSTLKGKARLGTSEENAKISIMNELTKKYNLDNSAHSKVFRNMKWVYFLN